MPTTNEKRTIIFKALDHFVNGIFNGVDISIKDLVKMMAEVAAEVPTYGLACQRDFRELTPLFARLFAYDNKHYYVYKAIQDPNKIGFLSCRQYTKFYRAKKNWHKAGIAGSLLSTYEQAFLEENGTMASPYKLMKRAFKENAERTRFLGRFFPLKEDKKTTANERQLIELCDTMMQLNTGIEFVPASIQECYDLDFHGSNIAGSSNRACTNSCMHGKKVGAFYEAFGAEGRMIYCHGQPVGRFLIWKRPEWKKGVIDRMYVHGEYMKDALAALDSQFPDSEWEKYPHPRVDENSEQRLVPLDHPEKLTEDTETPYIDTFANLVKNIHTNKYYLANFYPNSRSLDKGQLKYLEELRHTSTSHHMCNCPDCHEVFWSHDGSNPVVFGPRHKLYCKGFVPKTKEIKAYLDAFRRNINNIQEATNNAIRIERQSIFEI